jgi:hypothetical protein
MAARWTSSLKPSNAGRLETAKEKRRRSKERRRFYFTGSEGIAGPGGCGGFRLSQLRAFGTVQGLFGGLGQDRDAFLVLLNKAGFIPVEGARGGIVAFTNRLFGL